MKLELKAQKYRECFNSILKEKEQKTQEIFHLSNEIEIELGRIYYIKIPKKSSQSYFIKIAPDLNYEELNVVANCPSMKSFKIFMSKDSPSSQNTFKFIPSW